MVPVRDEVEPKLAGTKERVATFFPPLQVRGNYIGRTTPIFFSNLIPFILEGRIHQMFLPSTGMVTFSHRRQ